MNSNPRADAAVWRRFADAFRSKIQLPARIVRADSIAWIEPGPRMHRIVLSRYSRPETQVHRASVNLHEPYPMVTWHSLVIDGMRYALDTHGADARQCVSLLPRDLEWKSEFTFHADEAEQAGTWLARLACHPHGHGAPPAAPMPIEWADVDASPAEHLLGSCGYLWTAKASAAYAVERTAAQARERRRRAWREVRKEAKG